MKKVLFVMLILGMASVQVVKADEASHKALAEQLLVAMNVEEQTKKSFEQIKEMQRQRLSQMKMDPAMAAKSQEVQKKVMDFMTEEMSWGNLKNEYIAVYVEIFTEEELKGLVDFYKSPIGTVYIEKIPQVSRKMMMIGQERMMELMPKVQQMTEEAFAEGAAPMETKSE